MIAMMMLLAGCGGCVKEAPLLSVSDCSDESWNAHHTFYDKRTFAWSLSCPDAPEQAGVFLVGAVMRTEKLSEFETGVPCSKVVHGECPVMKEGMGSGMLFRSGDRPTSATYRYRCGDDSAFLALWFGEGGSAVRCDDTGACFSADATAAASDCRLSLDVIEPE